MPYKSKPKKELFVQKKTLSSVNSKAEEIFRLFFLNLFGFFCLFVILFVDKIDNNVG